MSAEREVIRTRIWEEEPEPDNPFAAAACFCRGYDVYGEILGHARWTEYVGLLFLGERPSVGQVRLLEDLAVVLANPGPPRTPWSRWTTAGAATRFSTTQWSSPTILKPRRHAREGPTRPV